MRTPSLPLSRRTALGRLAGFGAALGTVAALPAPVVAAPARPADADVRRWLAEAFGDAAEDVLAMAAWVTERRAALVSSPPTVDVPIPLLLNAIDPYTRPDEHYGWHFVAAGAGFLTGCRWRGRKVSGDTVRVSVYPDDLVLVFDDRPYQAGDPVAAQVGDAYELRRATRAREAGVIGPVFAFTPRGRSVEVNRPGAPILEAL